MRITPLLRTSFLLIALATVVHAQQPAGSIVIRVDGRESVLSAEVLRALPRHEARVVAEGSADSVVVSGVALWDVLQKAGVPPTEASGRQRADQRHARWIRGLVAISFSTVAP